MANRFNLFALAAFAAPALALPVDNGLWDPSALTFDNGLWKPEPTAAASDVSILPDLQTTTDTFEPSLPTSTAINTRVNRTSTQRVPVAAESFLTVTIISSSTEPAVTTSTPEIPKETTVGSPAAPGTKKSFTGDGSVGAGWPDEKDWISFDAIWSANLNALSTGCPAPIAQNTPDDLDAIKSGIASESASTGVDDRFILAAIIQESHGCVRIGQTESKDKITNPGIMQSHNGQFNCADGGDCPPEKITGMIHDGVSGTADGRGLKEELEAAKEFGGETLAQRAYIAMRLYNSGDFSYTTGADLSVGGATSSYSSDIANRLLGAVF